MYSRQNKRPSPRGRSADFQSAVSPICNRQSVQKPSARGLGGGPQNTILRYSRLKICATTYELYGLTSLEELNGSFVFLRRASCFERAKISSFPGLWIFLS